MEFFDTAQPVWYALAILLLPALGFFYNAFTYRLESTRHHGHRVPLLMIGIALFLSASLFAKVIFGHADPEFRFASLEKGLAFDLIRLGEGALNIEAGVLIDNLTAVMLVVVTVVSFLVHLYSIGYMHGDSRYPRFFAFLGLFSFSMLGLVLTDNLLVLFCFWELVGVCSYFLIGFWFEQDEPPKASIKAFMVNRFGDIGFLIGILIVYQMFGTLNIRELQEAISFVNATSMPDWRLLGLAGLLLFCGPMAKSAQVPMHVWLPDAMAGPTPVSALIHAATMVAAGVYMVGRMYFFFTPPVLMVIAVIGAITAVVAASIGLVHHNIKKVLAYSTCSQLGYMMLSLGVGGFSAGLFHLYTHAFFKACLFLGAGSVIHAVHSEDMRVMGGLKAKMPVTYRTFLIATLALAGVPFLSGAFSKEMIIEHAILWGMHGNWAQWLPAIIACFGAVLTFFYMMRLIHLTFWGEARDHHRFEHAHESPPTMTIPLLLLAILAVFSVGWPIPFLGGHTLPHLLQAPEPAAYVRQLFPGHGEHHAPGWLVGLVFLISLVILAVGWSLFVATYRKQKPSAEWWTRTFPWAYDLLSGLYYFDELYQATIVRGGVVLSRACRAVDVHCVDAAVNLVGTVGLLLAKVQNLFDKVVVDGLVDFWWHLSHALGKRLRRVQTGNVQDYLAFAVGGMLLLFLTFWFMKP